MSVLIMVLNLSSIFLFACSIKNLRNKLTHDLPTRQETFWYKTTSLFLMAVSLLIARNHWGNPGWVIGMNLTSINSFFITCFISYFPKIYEKWTREIKIRYFSHTLGH